MRGKIVSIINKCIDDFYRVTTKNEHQIADQILDLSVDGVITVGDLLTMWKNDYLKIEVTDKSSVVVDKTIRAKGWLHKDDPVKGLKVVKTCPCEELSARENCECTPERTLTVGEALKMLPNMVYLLSEKINDPLYRDVLTTKDGRIVEVKK